LDIAALLGGIGTVYKLFLPPAPTPKPDPDPFGKLNSLTSVLNIPNSSIIISGALNRY
jgi:hypothetical protein